MQQCLNVVFVPPSSGFQGGSAREIPVSHCIIQNWRGEPSIRLLYMIAILVADILSAGNRQCRTASSRYCTTISKIP